MEFHVGTLDLLPARAHPEWLAAPVAKALEALPDCDRIGAASIDPECSDTAAFCERYQVRPDQAANCVILEASRGDAAWYAACVVFGSTRADLNGLARRTLNARRVSFAPMDKAVQETGMAYGAITPIGLPPAWPILVDKAVSDAGWVVIGSGLRASKLAVPGSIFTSLTNVQILEGLGQAKA